jgi:hypothetical protein
MRQGLLAIGTVLVAACSGGKSSSAPPGDDGGGGGDDGGTVVQSYSPQGCAYTYTAPSTLNYQDWGPDDTGPVDPTNGVPQRVRVGLGGATTKGQPGYADPTTSAAFTWETAEANHAAKVKIGTSASSLTQVQPGVAWTAAVLNSPAYFHEVHVCGLTAGTTYFYQVGGGPSGQEVWSATQSFTTMPASGSITVGIFGDARDSKSTWQAVHERMKDPTVGVTMSLVGGDIVDIGASEPLYVDWLNAIWKDPNDATKFLTLGQQYILPINGNHENDTAFSFANWAIPGDGPYAETFASFDLGAAHIAMIDDEQIALAATGAEAQAQLAWLDSDLKAAAADRTAHPFIVVISHRGIFSTSAHSADPDVIAVRGALAPIFDKYAVSLVINGHDHEYERTIPINAGSPPTGDPTPNPQGTTYVISAGAGADAYAVGTAPVSWRATKTGFGPNATPSTYIGLYSLLTIAPTQLTLKAYAMNASGTTVANDVPIDTVTLTH